MTRRCNCRFQLSRTPTEYFAQRLHRVHSGAHHNSPIVFDAQKFRIVTSTPQSFMRLLFYHLIGMTSLPVQALMTDLSFRVVKLRLISRRSSPTQMAFVHRKVGNLSRRKLHLPI